MTSLPSADEKPSESFILDASALLALLLHEPGAQRVGEAISQGAIMGAVNLAEVVARLVDEGLTDEAIKSAIEGLELPVADFAGGTAQKAGLLRRATRHAGLSAGDRACLAQALELRRPALTADRIWATLDLGIDIQLIR